MEPTKGRRTSAAALAALLAAVALCASAQDKPARLQLPYYDRGACPFECCTYRDWTVDQDTTVRSASDDRAPVAFRLSRGDTVKALTGVVVTTQPGVVRVLKAAKLGSLRVPAGATLDLLTNQGEGIASVHYRGRIADADLGDSEHFRVERPARSVWWVQLRERGGRIGWSRQPDHFGNKDACG